MSSSIAVIRSGLYRSLSIWILYSRSLGCFSSFARSNSYLDKGRKPWKLVLRQLLVQNVKFERRSSLSTAILVLKKFDHPFQGAVTCIKIDHENVVSSLYALRTLNVSAGFSKIPVFHEAAEGKHCRVTIMLLASFLHVFQTSLST